MGPRFDGHYLSDRLRSEDWHAGVCMVSEYFSYLKLFENGFWLRKDHPTPDFDFADYLAGVAAKAFEDGLAGRDPLDQEYDFVHQTGTFIRVGERLEFVFRHFLVIMHEQRWALRVASPERLVSGSGAVYEFRPTTHAEPDAAADRRGMTAFRGPTVLQPRRPLSGVFGHRRSDNHGSDWMS